MTITDALLPASSSEETDTPTPRVLPRSTSTVSQVEAASASTAKNPWASFVNGLYSGASNLANLLPTGTFLAFTAISPIVTNNGACEQPYEMYLTIAVLVFFAFFCVISCYTDSYEAADGKVYYGLVTLEGLWTPQLPEPLHPGDKQQYKLTVVDVIHSILSLAVFAACALMTPNIRSCLYPNIRDDIVNIIPAVVGFFVSSIFVTFPSKRHGIGFPVSPSTYSFTSREFVIQQKSKGRADSEAAD